MTVTVANAAAAGTGGAGISFSNANTGTTNLLSVNTNAAQYTNSSLQTLRLTGSVAIFVNDTNTSATAGVANVIAGSDNARIVFDHSTAAALTGAAQASLGDVITVGNGGTVTGTGVTILSAEGTTGFGANVILTGSGQDTITVGSGFNRVTAGPGADTVTFASHGGTDAFLLSAGTAALLTATLGTDTGFIGGTSLTTAGTGFTFTALTSNSFSTSNCDVVTGLRAGDIIDFSSGYTATALSNRTTATNLTLVPYTDTTNVQFVTNLTNLAALDNGVSMVRGIYNALTQTFNGSATGTDTLLVVDANATVVASLANSTAFEAIVLVGYAATSTSSATLGVSGAITLA